jgi:hypothetical protein
VEKEIKKGHVRKRKDRERDPKTQCCHPRKPFLSEKKISPAHTS